MLFFTVVMMSGCVVEDAADPNDENLGEVEQGLIGGCPEWECGGNSPLLNGHPVLWIYESSEAVTPDGWRLMSFVSKQGISVRLDVEDGKLKGYDFLTGAVAISMDKANLVDSRMTIKNENTGELFYVLVAAAQRSYTWAKPVGWAMPPLIETYKFKWVEVKNCPAGTVCDWKNLCSDAPLDEGIPPENTILFEGDIINAQYKTISYRVDKGRANIGCAGSAHAKLMLTGHTYPMAAYGLYTTYLERQTALKMFTGDFTGSGKPYTQPKTPLRWIDNNGWMHMADQGDNPYGVTIESRWTPYGASCLSKARLPEIEAAIADDGYPVPANCEPSSPYQFDSKHLVSATPNPWYVLTSL